MKLGAIAPLLLCTVASASAQEAVQITHAAIPCAVPDRFPILRVDADPLEDVASVRIALRTERGDWFTVDLPRVGESWEGVLPAPRDTLGTFEYQVQVASVEAKTVESPIYVVRVLRDGCAAASAGAVPQGGLVVQRPAGAGRNAPLVPNGFKPQGVAGSIGQFDLGPVTAVAAGVVLGAGALVAFRKTSDKDSAQPALRLLSASPASGSTLHAGDPVEVRFHVEAGVGAVILGTVRVEYGDCAAVETRLGRLEPKQGTDVTVAGPLLLFPSCATPATVTARAILSDIPATVRDTLALDLTYTLVR